MNRQNVYASFYHHIKIVNLIAEISAKIERYAMLVEQISASTAKGESTPFIEFMLGEILSTLTRNQVDESTAEVEYIPIKVPNIFPNNIPNIFPNKFRKEHPSVAISAWYVGSLLNNTPGANADEIGLALGLTGRTVRKYIAQLRDLGIAKRIGSNKTGYWEINLNE